MKMKEFGPPGGGASLVPPLDPPMQKYKYFYLINFLLGVIINISSTAGLQPVSA